MLDHPKQNKPNSTPHPYISANTRMAEFSLRAILMGALLGMLFGASSLYLVLKVGLTVSASIPVAVIAIALFRLNKQLGGNDSTILENSIAQTAGSAGESIAFGLGVTMPAILILGFDLELSRILLVGVLGGMLGILMMIPLRQMMIVDQHKELKYPEGTACAEVLKAAAQETSDDSATKASHRQRAHVIFAGFGLGLLYKCLNVALKGWKDTPNVVFGPPFKNGSIGAEVSPELLGVGYIIGPKIASIMAAGGVMSYLLFIPMIAYFGGDLTTPLAPGTLPIRDMSPDQIRSAYILYMGAGAVAVGGVISLLRAAPLIWRSIYANVRGAFLSKTSLQERRTDESISMKWVLIGIIAIMTAISLAEPLHMNIVGAALIAIVGFLFSGVSSRLTGQIGSSSNPISGLTVGTLLLTCLIFLALGWTGSHYYVTALSVGAIVCVAASNAGATSQDLKTGFLVGSTPRMQQYAILIGALSSALILGPILLKLNDASTVYVPAKELSNLPQVDSRTLNERAVLTGPQALSDSRSYFVWRHKDGKYLVDEEGHIAYLVDPGINGSFTHRPDGSEVQKFSAPKAVLISYIIKGILDQHLPWALVLFGVMIALILEMSGVSSLAFAVGVYLPLASTMPIFVGGMVRWFSDRRRNASHYATSDQSSGVLLASGYIAGGALAGIVIAIMTGALTPFNDAVTQWAMQHNPFYEGVYANVLSLLPYGALVVLLYWVGRHVK